MRFGRARHKHDLKPKIIREIDQFHHVEQCSCGKRRLSRLGYGSESGIYYSRWFDIEELEKFKRCFPELFNKEKKRD